MNSQAEENQAGNQQDLKHNIDDEALLPGIVQDRYNTVYERIIARTSGEHAVSIVVACVAYSLYKEEKRDWIVKRREETGRRPGQAEIDSYVSGCTDLRIESLLTQARNIIGNFARDVLESSKEEIRDEIYRRQFENLHDQMSARAEHDRISQDAMKSHIDLRTRSSWRTSIGQNLVANFIWTGIVVVLLISLNLGFDFNNFASRVKAFFNPPQEVISKKGDQ